MLEDVLGLIGVYVLAFVLNAVPGLMPPTWIVVSALVVKFDLPLLFAAIGAAFAGGFGRCVIARYAMYVRPLLRGRIADLDALNRTFESRPQMVALTSFLYSIVLPTNVLFAAAGLSGTGLRWILGAYWLARIPIDTALVWTAESITREVLVDSYRSPIVIALQVVALGLFFLLLKLPWSRWLTITAPEVPGDGS